MLRPTVNGQLCVHNSHELRAGPISYDPNPNPNPNPNFNFNPYPT